MAAVNGNMTVHATLSTTVVDTVTLVGGMTRVVVSNPVAAAADIYFTVSLTGTAPVDPVVAANDTYKVPAGKSKSIYARGGVIIKVLGNGNVYDVEGDSLGMP
jgi:hypothetical protein